MVTNIQTFALCAHCMHGIPQDSWASEVRCGTAAVLQPCFPSHRLHCNSVPFVMVHFVSVRISIVPDLPGWGKRIVTVHQCTSALPDQSVVPRWVVLGHSAHAMPHAVHPAVGRLCLQDPMGGVGLAVSEHGAACVCMFDTVQKRQPVIPACTTELIAKLILPFILPVCHVFQNYTPQRKENLSKSDVGESCKGGKQCMGPCGLDNYSVPS